MRLLFIKEFLSGKNIKIETPKKFHLHLPQRLLKKILLSNFRIFIYNSSVFYERSGY